MANDKRLLFLSWFFPPNNAIAAVRTGNIAQELIKHGWDITIVTMDPLQAVRPCNGASLTSAKLHYLYLDDSHDPCQQNILRLKGIWGKSYYFTAICRKLMEKRGLHEEGIYRAIMKACQNLKNGDFDLILASGSPFCQFRAAALLSARLKCPYVLDYRDPWSQNQHLKNKSLKLEWREKKLLQGAKTVLAATPTLAQMISDLGGRPVQTINNGFSEPDPTVADHQFSAPTLVFAGNLYPPQITLAPIMEALAKIKDRTVWRLYYCGKYTGIVRDEAQKFGIADLVDCDNHLPRREAQQRIRGATLAVAVSSSGPKSANRHDQCIIPAKIYEAMGLNVPILLIAPADNDGAKLIDLTGTGFHFCGTDIQKIADFLSREDFSISPTNNKDDYSWQSLGTKLDAILTGAIS